MTSDRTPALARVLYPTGLLLLIAPMLELMARIWPLQLHLIQWRYQAGTAFLSAMPVVMMGLLVLALAAHFGEQPRVLRLAGVAALLLAVVLLPLLVGYALDAVQFRAMVESGARGPLRNRSLVTGATGLVAVVAAVSLGIGAWRAGKPDAVARRSKDRKSGEAETLLISDPR